MFTVKLKQDVSLTPNPSTGDIHVEFTQDEHEKKVIKSYNLMGQLIQ